MKKTRSKSFTIVIVLIILLALAGGVFAYAYFCTDLLRTSQELFAKYLTQNMSEINQTLGLEKFSEVEEKIRQNKNEENIEISFSEADANEAFVKLTIDSQNDLSAKKNYGKLGFSLEGMENPLEVEYMVDKDLYSLRFTNAVKQFLSIENNDLKELAKKLGADETAIEEIPDFIDFDEFSLNDINFAENEKNTEIDKYSKVLYNSISAEKYTKSKDAVITVNGKTITTNSYVLTLNSQDIKNIAINLLETLKQDEIVLAKLQLLDEKLKDYADESIKESFIDSIDGLLEELKQEELSEENIKITIYEMNKKTVRIKLEQGIETITIDTTETDEKKQINMNYTEIDEDNVQLTSGVTLVRDNNKLTLDFYNTDGEEQENNTLVIELTEKECNIMMNIALENAMGKLEFIRTVNFVNEINYEVTLDDKNNLILNDLSAEQISAIMNVVGERINTEYISELQPLLFLFSLGNGMIKDNALNNTGPEIQAFNSVFTAYEGDNVSTADINVLLSLVYSHNANEAMQLTERYVTITGDITLDIDAVSAPILPGQKTYKVECKTGEDGYINEIVITEVVDINENM